MTKIDLATLDQFGPLQKGAHEDYRAICVMEAVAFVAGEAWSDSPECACPVIAAFLRTWNDALPDDERDALLRPLIPLLVGTRSTPAVEMKRSLLAADWLVRVHTPAWLRLAKLDKQADLLESLPEITDMAQVPSIRPAIEAVRDDARAARAAVGAAAGDATWAAAGDAAWAAAGDDAWDAAWAAAREAAWDAVGDAAGDALNPTRLMLQQSALGLVKRMIAVTEETP